MILRGQFLAWCKRKKFDDYYAHYTYKVTHRSRWAHTKTCGAFWERVGPRTLREINLRAILYEWTFYRQISSETCTCKHNRVLRRDPEPDRIPEATPTTLKRLRRKGRKPKEFVYERIRLSAEVLLATSLCESMWKLEELQRVFVSFIRRG